MTEPPTGVLPPEPPPDRGLGWGLVVGLLMLLVAGAGVAAGYVVAANKPDHTTTMTTTLHAGTRTADRTVPDVVGLDEDEAVVRLSEAGFKANDTFRPTAKPTGKVVSQDPEAGAKAAKGATILLVVDRGAPKSARVIVPAVEGQRVSEAQERLRAAGLDSNVFVIAADDPRGTVTSQDPKAGEKADRGSLVRLNVSAGSAGTTTVTTTRTTTRSTTTTPTTTAAGPVTMPDVVGLTRAEASQKLAAVGLVGSFVTVPSSEPEGTVVAQAKPPGTTLQRGSRVQINVSSGES